MANNLCINQKHSRIKINGFLYMNLVGASKAKTESHSMLLVLQKLKKKRKVKVRYNTLWYGHYKYIFLCTLLGATA